MFDNRACRRRGDTGKRIRLSRIFNTRSGRALVVPMDHSVTIGPLGKADHADRTAAMLAVAGVDAIVVHKGRARSINPVRAHLDKTSRQREHASSPDCPSAIRTLKVAFAG